MRKLLIVLPLAALMLAACGGIEKSEEAASDVEAAQMMGREEARKYLNRPWSDTLELQRQLLQSRAKKSVYEMKKQPEMAEAYDSAFIKTLRTVRPELARQLTDNAPAK